VSSVVRASRKRRMTSPLKPKRWQEAELSSSTMVLTRFVRAHRDHSTREGAHTGSPSLCFGSISTAGTKDATGRSCELAVSCVLFAGYGSLVLHRVASPFQMGTSHPRRLPGSLQRSSTLA